MLRRMPGELDIKNAPSEANLLKLIWKPIRKWFANMRKACVATQSGSAKIVPRCFQKSRAMRSRPSILHPDEEVLDMVAVYRSTDEPTTWIPVDGITSRRNVISTACRDLHTFEFEFEFCGRGSNYGRKTN